MPKPDPRYIKNTVQVNVSSSDNKGPESPAEFAFPEGEVCLCRNLSDSAKVVWDIKHEALIRRFPETHPNQSVFRLHFLDSVNHADCLCELIPKHDWVEDLSAPGMPGRIARLSYTVMRTMKADTFVRLCLKLPRKKRLAARDCGEAVAKLIADPSIRNAFGNMRFTQNSTRFERR